MGAVSGEMSTWDIPKSTSKWFEISLPFARVLSAPALMAATSASKYSMQRNTPDHPILQSYFYAENYLEEKYGLDLRTAENARDLFFKTANRPNYISAAAGALASTSAVQARLSYQDIKKAKENTPVEPELS